ncbi:flagellar protein FlgN [Ornithinibacillus sp. 4-3]|uniref:Flagellar protein FlgN n=1 Tax=Ornithinibacillus sp. 4-3 TaxID=3231488 RepID=A0AB39HU44_9BACI
MSTQSIIAVLQQLIEIHQDMIKLSEEKTEIIKEGSVEKLQKQLVREQKLIRLLEQAENNRQQEVISWYRQADRPLEEITITNILNVLEDEEERNALEEAAVQLANAVMKLKQQEQLNHSLLQQSMQFVQFSLNMINPTIENFNYGNQQTGNNRSVFDSKA